MVVLYMAPEKCNRQNPRSNGIGADSSRLPKRGVITGSSFKGQVLESFDTIIVGAGSSGCVIANRLSESGRDRVLLIEAGGGYNDPMILMPKGFSKLMNDRQRAWRWPAQRFVANESLGTENWIRGRALGGSSSINGMIYSRGHMQDYEDWKSMAGPDWGWDAMKKAFMAIEDHALPPTDFRARGGPLHVQPCQYRYPLAESFIKAGEEMGYRRKEDINEPDHEGIGYYNYTIHNGRRWSAAHAFLAPAMKRRNLTVVTHVEVERILFEGRRAVGVQARRDGQPVEYRCTGEVIVCAGAVNSPLLLQQSGIGPAERLRAAGVEVRADAPDVGRCMREHLGFAMPHRLLGEAGLNGRLRGVGLLASVLQYGLFRSGILASGPYEVGAFVRSDPSVSRPDIQMYLGAFSMGRPRDGLPPTAMATESEPGLTISCHAIRLTSHSELWITAPEGRQPAVIKANWLSTEEDQRTVLRMTRLMRRFMRMPALAPHVGAELLPGAAVQSDAQMMEAIKKLHTSAIHATGSCRMGTDADSVVDPRLKVRGTENLRVVDCSVMPGLIAGNTNAPAIALAWRAADLWQQSAEP